MCVNLVWDGLKCKHAEYANELVWIRKWLSKIRDFSKLVMIWTPVWFYVVNNLGEICHQEKNTLL